MVIAARSPKLYCEQQQNVYDSKVIRSIFYNIKLFDGALFRKMVKINEKQVIIIGR